MKTLYFLWASALMFFIGCVSEDYLFEEPVYITEVPSNNKVGTCSAALSEGQLNAVKKARQITDILFIPKDTIDAKNNIYFPNIAYKGLIYSSVKELDTYVGPNISFHTFMTAVNNPRSVIYTEHIDKYPYHGVNCRAYYGTMCNGLVSYALGIDYISSDFPISNVMTEVDYSSLENLEVADVLWIPGHVTLITDVQKNKQGVVQNIEICESNLGGARRYTKSREEFISMTGKKFEKVYRYTELYKNVSYIPAQEFVPVLDEAQIPFVYNDDLCVNKGDKSCYLEGESITVNIFRDYEYLEIYKDNSLYDTIDASKGFDVVISELPYGDYKARICYQNETSTGIHTATMSTRSVENKCFSDYTCWKVINIELLPDRENNKLFFSSANATPCQISFRSLSGEHLPYNDYLNRDLTIEERLQGYVDVPPEKLNTSYPYVHLLFSTDYGNVINKPFNWIVK